MNDSHCSRPPGQIRPVREDDAVRMLEIYQPFITQSAVSFEYEVPSQEVFRKRVTDYSHDAPWYVWETEGTVVGYAYASKHRERAAYQWAVEVSVYLDSKFRRQGIGRALYEELFRDLTQRGFHVALAGITLPHPQSVGFHESMGFVPVGIYRRIGFKFGNWHDVGWWQKNLKSENETPTPISAHF